MTAEKSVPAAISVRARLVGPDVGGSGDGGGRVVKKSRWHMHGPTVKLRATPSPKEAIACCRRTGNADPDDLYPDLDAKPLRSALAGAKAASTLVTWDDLRVNWDPFSHILVSTWDSVDQTASVAQSGPRPSTVATPSTAARASGKVNAPA
jgi:hypothetical protein